MKKTYFSRSVLLTQICLLGLACSSSKDSDPVSTNNQRISPIYNGPPEISYCSSTKTYSGNTITVSGSAKYKARQTTSSGLGAPGAAAPIRYAEVRVTNSSGSVVQCGETDSAGAFSLILPRGASKFTISVNARAKNGYLNISVLDAPERNVVYALKKTIVADANQTGIVMVAKADGDVLGGAFNIYDQILNVNEYLRIKVGTCSHTGCENFTVAPKVSAYWELGFNPGEYFNAGGVSFYYPGYSRLFILGGVGGDYDHSDTDHFDNSIIIHEYGHFLEDAFSNTNSPGGSHSGNKMIDARLAWSEGFANFLNAAVRAYFGSDSDANYIDTLGNIDGDTGLVFNIDIESYSNCPGNGCDLPDEVGEGVFREFAITRYLYDAVDNTATESENGFTDNVSDMFSEIWASMTTDTGFNNTSFSFRDVGLLNYVESEVITGSSWANIRQMHGMPNDNTPGYDLRKEYAYYVDNHTTCTNTFTIDTLAESGVDRLDSNLYRNNEFLWYKHSGGNATFTLTRKSGTADLDLYIYDSTASFIDAPVKFSEGSGGSESVTISSLAAGNYLINVYAWECQGTDATFELKINGVDLCPRDLP